MFLFFSVRTYRFHHGICQLTGTRPRPHCPAEVALEVHTILFCYQREKPPSQVMLLTS